MGRAVNQSLARLPAESAEHIALADIRARIKRGESDNEATLALTYHSRLFPRAILDLWSRGQTEGSMERFAVAISQLPIEPSAGT
jgi:hypothetical protein